MRPPPHSLTLACVVAAALAASGCGGDGGGAGGGAGTVVWAIGDGGAGTDAAKQVAAQVAKDDPKAVIFLGDVGQERAARRPSSRATSARSTATS